MDGLNAAPAVGESVYDQFAPLYRAAGLRVVPIGPGTKYPATHVAGGVYVAMVGWTTREPVSEPQPGAGIGLLCGTPLIAADIDTNDEGMGIELIDAVVLDSDNGAAITKIGQRGQTLLLRPPPGVAVKSRKFLIDGKCVFEMLAEGRQTVLPPTQHPDLKQPYRWGNGATPLNTDLDKVAVLRSDWLERVEEVLCRYGYNKEAEPGPTAGYDESSPFQQINQLALADLTRWVPDLNLYKFRRGRGYLNYEAVATWRPSSTERPNEQRNPNLKISPKRGIVDFGTGKGYSPLDLVMAARACSLNEAFDWLQAKLGPDSPAREERVVEFESKARENETPRQEPKLRFKLVPFSSMRPGLEQLYLVDELIPVAGLVDIWGPPKCFKSFWTLDLMLHVAKGWEYRDRCVHQGAVVYCAFEGGHGYKKRIEALRRHYALDPEEEVPVYIMPGQANLIGEHKILIEDIRAQLGSIKPVAVVLDTLNKSLLGSESKDVDMSAYVRAAEAVRDAFGCVVIIVHHCGLDETRPRGHTSLPGAVDAQLAVTRDGNVVTVTVEMMRDGPEDTAVTGVVESIDVGEDENGKTLTSLVVSAGEAPVKSSKRRWAPSLDTFRRALNEALIGSDRTLNVGGADFRVVDLEFVRREFYSLYQAKGDTSTQQQDNRKHRFRYCADRAQRDNLMGVRVVGGVTLVWLAAPEGETGRKPQSEEG